MELKKTKIDSPHYSDIFTPELNILQGLFSRYDYKLKIAGGAVRDLISGKIPHDIDFATTATPDEMKSMFNKEGIRLINNRGESHGTITCRINEVNFEVTTLRIDVRTDGRHAEVQFTTDWKLDAERRDLTVNAMFLDFEGYIYDYYNGVQDLHTHTVRFVGDPVIRIQEDYLRILRYFRFYGRIADSADQHDESSLQAIKENKSGLSGIAGERLWVELKKIATGNYSDSIVKLMIDLDIGPHIGLPNKTEADTLEYDTVWNCAKDLSPEPVTLLVALMSTEEHLNKFDLRLKVSKFERQTAAFILKHRRASYNTSCFTFCQNLLCDNVTKEPKAKLKIIELLKYWGKNSDIHTFESWQLPSMPVTGIELLQVGVEKGPKLAQKLAYLREKWKASGFTLNKKELLEIAKL